MSVSSVGSAVSPKLNAFASDTTEMRSAWCSRISAREYSARTGTPRTSTGRRGPGTFETFNANERGWASARSANRRRGGTRASSRVSASSC